MDFKELKEKTLSELHKIVAEYRNTVRELRFKDSSKQLKDVRSIREAKQVIAQILTLINQKNKVKGDKK
ncbi:MAG: 50S ribosomal protein L29 [Planctomycetes bacterium]|jgi:large subunit ribosomal protein L29|nr:50S ribosomal protein L29 [Planctomycetota bacterium]